jgi:hypothetical protein
MDLAGIPGIHGMAISSLFSIGFAGTVAILQKSFF